MQKAQREGEKACVLLSIAFRVGAQTSKGAAVIRQSRLIILQVVEAPTSELRGVTVLSFFFSLSLSFSFALYSTLKLFFHYQDANKQKPETLKI